MPIAHLVLFCVFHIIKACSALILEVSLFKVMEACLDSTWSLVSSRNDRMILLLPQTSEQRQKDYLSMFKYDNSLPKVTAAIFIVERTNK